MILFIDVKLDILYEEHFYFWYFKYVLLLVNFECWILYTEVLLHIQ